MPSVLATKRFTPYTYCVASYNVSRSPSHRAIVECGSIALWVSIGVVYRPSIVTSLCCSALRTLPRRLAGSNCPKIFCV